MAFVSVSKTARQKMFREGGYREREIMKNSVCTTITSLQESRH